jgi:hypothetical protein
MDAGLARFMPLSVGIRAFWRRLESSTGSGGVGAVQLGGSAGRVNHPQHESVNEPDFWKAKTGNLNF